MKDLKEYLIQETIVMTRQGIPSNADYVVYAINVGKIKRMERQNSDGIYLTTLIKIIQDIYIQIYTMEYCTQQMIHLR